VFYEVGRRINASLETAGLQFEEVRTKRGRSLELPAWFLRKETPNEIALKGACCDFLLPKTVPMWRPLILFASRFVEIAQEEEEGGDAVGGPHSW